MVWPQEGEEREKRNLETTSELYGTEDYSDIMVAHPVALRSVANIKAINIPK